MAMPSDEDEECSVVLNPLPRSLLRSLSAQGRCSATAAAGTSGEDSNGNKHRRRHRKHRRRESTRGNATAEESEPSPSVNPIFVWVKQDGTRIVEVLCEDYDKRNRIRLTKTAHGWRAIPRTERLVSATALATTEQHSLPPPPPPPEPTTQMTNALENGHGVALPTMRQRRRLPPPPPRGASHVTLAGDFESGDACAMTPPMSHEEDVEEFEMIKTDEEEAAATRLELDEEDERERLAVEMCERATISEDLIDDSFDHDEMPVEHDDEMMIDDKMDDQEHLNPQELIEEHDQPAPEHEMETDDIIDEHSDCLVDPETMVESESFVENENEEIDQDHELENECLLVTENINEHENENENEGSIEINEHESLIDDPEGLVESETIEENELIEDIQMNNENEIESAELNLREEQTNFEEQEMERMASNEDTEINDEHHQEYINETNENLCEEDIDNREDDDDDDNDQGILNEHIEESITNEQTEDDRILLDDHEIAEQQLEHENELIELEGHVQAEENENDEIDSFSESRQLDIHEEIEDDDNNVNQNENCIQIKDQNINETPINETPADLTTLVNNKIKIEKNSHETVLETNPISNYSNINININNYSKKTEKIPKLEESHKMEMIKENETKKALNTILGLNNELEIKPIQCLTKPVNENKCNNNNNNIPSFGRHNKNKEDKNIFTIKPEKLERVTIIKPEPIEEDELPKDLSIKKPIQIQPTPLKIPKVAQHLNKPKSLFLESLLSSPRITAVPVQSSSEPPSPPPSTSPIKLSPQTTTTTTTTTISQIHRASGSPTVTCSQDVQKNKRKSEEHEIDELTLKGLLHRTEKRPRLEKQISHLNGSSGGGGGGDKGRKSRLLELLTAEPEATPSAQLKRVLSDPERPVPDPLLVPRSRLAELVANPAKEIPRLLTTRPELRLPEALAFPALLRDPDLLVISLAHLHAMTQHPDNLEEDERGCSSLGGFLEWHRYQSQASRNSTTATLNQMLWLPYLSQLEASALACGNNQEFLAMLNAVFPTHGYPPPAPPSPFLPPPPTNGASSGFPVIDFKAQLELQQTLAVWQEAMLQATSPPVKSSLPPTKSSRNSQLKKLNNNNNITNTNNNNIININNNNNNNNNNNTNGFLSSSRNYSSHHVPTHSRSNGVKSGKHMTSYNAAAAAAAAAMNAFPGSQQLQYNHALQQVPQLQVPRNNKQSNDTKRNGITCKSLLNLLSNQPQQQNPPPVTAPTQLPRRPAASPMDLTSRRGMSNGSMTASLASSSPPPRSTTSTSTAKLKVKQHLVDPNLRPGRLLKHDVTNTSPDADLATRLQTANHPALWHPLFGSQKTSYSSPWQWTTVTVNGE